MTGPLSAKDTGVIPSY